MLLEIISYVDRKLGTQYSRIQPTLQILLLLISVYIYIYIYSNKQSVNCCCCYSCQLTIYNFTTDYFLQCSFAVVNILV